MHLKHEKSSTTLIVHKLVHSLLSKVNDARGLSESIENMKKVQKNVCPKIDQSLMRV